MGFTGRIPSFANAAAEENPQLAWHWATTLTTESLRHGALENAGRGWLRVDEPAARAAIAASGLPDYSKEVLLKPGN